MMNGQKNIKLIFTRKLLKWWIFSHM